MPRMKQYTGSVKGIVGIRDSLLLHIGDDGSFTVTSSPCFCRLSVASWPSNVMVVALPRGLMDSKDLVSRDRLQTL
jgi:hypothetical protein